MTNRMYMDYLHEPDYDDAPPLTMTPEVARALIVAHDEGRGMSDELLARARECVSSHDDIREVTIPRVVEHGGSPFNLLTVKLRWVCPKCGAKRNKPLDGYSFDGSRRLNVNVWHSCNCGNIDDYASVRKEARENGLNDVAPVVPIALVFNDAQWRSDISWIWMRELARGNIATTPIKGADLQAGQVVADSDHTLYRMIEPMNLGELGWSGKVYRQWKVESVNSPRSSVSLKPFFVEQEYRLSEE